MLALFPEERPDYSSDYISGSSDFFAESRLSIGAAYMQANTTIRRCNKVSHGISRVVREKLSDDLVGKRLLDRAIKQSFYKAALSFLEIPPVWGSLTGIRPAKIAREAIESGATDKAAAEILRRKYFVSPERASMCLSAANAAIALGRVISPGDIALYVGIPFCRSRCSYCSFVSNSVEKDAGLVEPFVQTLLSEITAMAGMADELGMRVISVYIGGGTPTALSPNQLELVMRTLKESFDLSNVREYTVEAGRPDTLTEQKLDIARSLGAGRICINPQSMSDDVLAAIGRKHTPQEVLEAIRLVRQHPPEQTAADISPGITLNMDVIAGLPGDSPEGFRQTLDTILSCEPENVTVHTLSLKRGSRITLENTKLPSVPEVASMLDYANRTLRGRGYAPYYLYRQKFTTGGFENTGWSLPGHEGMYNICMMEELCTVLAMGGGGVTKIVLPNGRIERIFNAKYPREYILKADETDSKIEKVRGCLPSAIPVLH